MRNLERATILAPLLVVALALQSCGSGPADSEVTDTGEDEEPRVVIRLPSTSGEGVGCGSEQRAFITALNVLETPAMGEPDPRRPYVDPVFGTCVVRVTDRFGDLPSDDPSRGIKNEYSRAQSFNVDGSLLVARSIEAFWYLYDAATLEVLGQLPVEVEPRWDGEDPFVLRFFDEARLMALDIESGKRSVVHDFAADFPDRSLTAVWTRYEGSPSRDGRYWGLMAQDDDWHVIALLVYDLEQDEVVAVRHVPDGAEIDAVTISPLGTYLLAYFDNYCEEGRPGDQDDPCGLMVYDRDLGRGRSLLPIIGHSDTALDAGGEEVLIFQDIWEDNISMLHLESGEVTVLFPIDFSHSPIGFHFSGRAFQRPGWAVIATYSGAEPSATWMDDQVFLVELKKDGRVVRLAHTHSVVDQDMEHDYWAEPQASANLDLTRIVFTSNWGRSGSEDVEMHMIILPSDWTYLIGE